MLFYYTFAYKDTHVMSLLYMRLVNKPWTVQRSMHTVKPLIYLDNKIVDDSDVVGASPVGAVPNTYSFLI